MTVFRPLALGLVGLAFAANAFAGGDAKHAHGPEEGWPFEGATGQFEMDSVQRGYQVYKEVCSSCHGMKLMSYRNLGEATGPFYDPAYPNANDNPYVKALAADNEILDTSPNEVGDYDFRPARPSDTFRSPYANDAQARASNNGALPPDLSVITKARHGGASYIYSLLTGYVPEEAYSSVEIAPASDGGTPDDTSDDTRAVFETRIDVSKLHGDGHGDDSHGDTHATGYIIEAPGQYYNPYMAGDTTASFVGDPRLSPKGGFLAMTAPLLPDRVTYNDGTEATVSQMAYDVSQFLAWAGEPKQENRKSLGLAVLGYLFVLAILLWFSYKRIWRKIEH